MALNLRNLEAMITNFISSLDKGPETYMVHYPLLIEKLLQWHKNAWVNWIGAAASNGNIEWITIYETVRQGIQKIGKKSINANQFAFSVTFLKSFIKHLEDNKETKVETNKGKWFYREYAYKVLFGLIVEFIGASDFGERDFFWKQIPPDWKITASNLRENKVFANLAATEFIDWALNKIGTNQKDEFDITLDDITGNLFPEVNSKSWETIILIACIPFDPQDRVKSVIQHPWNIGLYSLRDLGFENVVVQQPESAVDKAKRIAAIDEKIKTATEKTFEMALLVFRRDFTKEYLEKSISDAKKLKYPDDSRDERKRKDVLETLEGLYQFLTK